jgi:hypothetical protein
MRTKQDPPVAGVRTQLQVDHITIHWDGHPRHQSCQAIAQVSYPIGERGDRRLEWLSSGGLHDIDTPSDWYRAEIEREELDDLRTHLAAFGIVLNDTAWAAVKAEGRVQRTTPKRTVRTSTASSTHET